ncbi:MAG TPA: nucleotidyltransferase family protein [Devosiaceae bacterium]|jgi:MurNAc alpha-1-phosphate uridylyltransferase
MSDRFLPDVMLLAAGLGRRMLPLTETTPKPLLEVAGKPLLDRVVANAWAEGLTRFAINTHYLGPQVAAHARTLERRYAGITIKVSDESDQLLDTGGGLKRALPLLATDPVLVMNTDAFWPQGADAPLGRLTDLYGFKGAELALLCVQPRRASGMRHSHDFCLAPDAAITNDRGQPVLYAGVALISAAVVAAAPDGPFSLYRLMEEALERGTVHGLVLDAPWFHVGDPHGLAEAEARLRATA